MSAPPKAGVQPKIKGAMKEGEEIIDEDTLTEKQKMRRKMETNREAVKDEIGDSEADKKKNKTFLESIENARKSSIETKRLLKVLEVKANSKKGIKKPGNVKVGLRAQLPRVIQH